MILNYIGLKNEVSFKYYRDGLLGFDAFWQEPAITEKHAFQCMLNSSEVKSNDVLYIAFPWASLIDGLARDVKLGSELREYLSTCVFDRSKYQRIITVCQHIKFRDSIDYFISVGVTDIYASHCRISERVCNGVTIHPFPIFPVQSYKFDSRNIGTDNPLSERKYLYSFVGAFDSKYYLTDARKLIFELPVLENALVVERVGWHFEKHVYQDQINNIALTNVELEQVDKVENEYVEVLKKTQFSLCPSGTGPNSIRLWESIAFGCIPVILADDLRLPGDFSLWEKACIFIGETEQEIQAMPVLLSELIKNDSLIKEKLKAVTELNNCYGQDNFIHDIKQLYEFETSLEKKALTFYLDNKDLTAQSINKWLEFFEILMLIEDSYCQVNIALGEANAEGFEFCFERLYINVFSFSLESNHRWAFDNAVFVNCSKVITHCMLDNFEHIYVTTSESPNFINTSYYHDFEYVVLNQFKGKTFQFKEWKPYCSILTSMFNGDEYLNGFLTNSQELFSYGMLEHFIVRPNSKGFEHENVLQFVQENSNVVYIWLHQDPGLYDVWNLTAKLSTSKFLTNANIDDRRSPRHISMILSCMDGLDEVDVGHTALKVTEQKNHAWKGIDLLDSWYVNDIAKVYRSEELFAVKGDGVSSCNMPHCMPIWKKLLHVKNGGFDELNYGPSADWEFWLRCGQSGTQFVNQGEALGLYLKDPKSYWSRHAQEVNYDDRIKDQYYQPSLGKLEVINLKGECIQIDYAKKLENYLVEKQYLRFLCELVKLAQLYKPYIHDLYDFKEYLMFVGYEFFSVKDIFILVEHEYYDFRGDSCLDFEATVLKCVASILHAAEKVDFHQKKILSGIVSEVGVTLGHVRSLLLKAFIAKKIDNNLNKEAFFLNEAFNLSNNNTHKFWEELQLIYRFSSSLNELVNKIDSLPNASDSLSNSLTATDTLYYFPDYAHGNPYQHLLYQGLKGKAYTVKGINQLDDLLNLSTCVKGEVLHIHWINILFKGKNANEYDEIIENFLMQCKQLQARGMLVYWTIHNLYSHDTLDKAKEKVFRNRLFKLSDKVFVHHPSLLYFLKEWLEVTPKIEFIEHGNYIVNGRKPLTRDEARAKLGVKNNDILLVVMGQIRPYKNLSRLLPLIHAVMNCNKSVKLMVAGKISCELTRSALSALPVEQTVVIDKFISAEKLELISLASSYIILSYQDILTSGSMFQALSFNRKVIAPNLGSISSYVIDGWNGFLYEDESSFLEKLHCAISFDELNGRVESPNPLCSVRMSVWPT